MLLVGQRQHGHGAWHPHRAATHHGAGKGQGLAAGIQKQRGCGASGSSLAAIKSLGGFAVKVQQEGAAAQAAALGLYQRQHHLHRNSRVYRAAARAQNLQARLGGQGVGRRHGIGVGGPAGFGAKAAGAFGLCRGTGCLDGGRGGGGAARQAQKGG